MRRGSTVVGARGRYFIRQLGLRLAFVHASASSVWPPTVICAGAFPGPGSGSGPAILCAAFFRERERPPAPSRRRWGSASGTRWKVWWRPTW